MARGDIQINFEATGTKQVGAEIDALTERLQNYQKAGLVSGQDVAALRSRAISQNTAQQSFVVSKQAQQLAAAGAKFSQGMSMGAGALTLAARAMGQSTGALSQVAAALGNFGAIGSGALAYLGQGGTLGKIGMAGAGLGIFGAGYGVGDWIYRNALAPFINPTDTDEYRERAARAAEKFRRENQARFNDAAFARDLAGTSTSEEATTKLTALENELFERVQKFSLGLDGSRENQDTIVRLEKQIVALKEKQAKLLTDENAKRQADLSAARSAETESIIEDATVASRERKFAREYESATTEEQIRIARERLERANADATSVAGRLLNANGAVSDEEFERMKQKLVSANAEIARFEDLLFAAERTLKSETEAREKAAAAEAEARRKSAEAQAKAEQEAVFAGGYQSSGNSLARVGLMASSPVMKGIDITAKNTEAIAKAAQEILRKVDKGTVARAG